VNESKRQPLSLLYLGTDGTCEVRSIPYSLEALQQLVEGQITTVYVEELDPRGLVVYYDDNGLEHGHPHNPFSRHLGQPHVPGPILVARLVGDRASSLTDDDVTWLTAYFTSPPAPATDDRATATEHYFRKRGVWEGPDAS